jgi:hypothetical protein
MDDVYNTYKNSLKLLSVAEAIILQNGRITGDLTERIGKGVIAVSFETLSVI